MMLVDVLLKPVDSYWRKQYNLERVKRQRAEADAKYATDTMEEQEKNLDRLTRRDVGQARAIEAYNREREELQKELAEKDAEIAMLRECLRSERAAVEALKSNRLLWEQLKARAKEAEA